ncbi:hypothetical protein G9272_00805 [Streptomyces asoensis]|uniref:Uncharacterized protein n=1 Tax=Streptomyces asoensis TaxID=249586 RepID=A0A6M4WEJ4_9ACTN|nr:hypothetical protein [Streptomyces asoensis]QJS99056.1 hypothetical protein G9272_00805 [Streptomyces asoensis]
MALTLTVVIAAFVAFLAAVVTAVLSRLDGSQWPAAVLHGGAAFGGTLTLGVLLIALYRSV